MKRFILAFAVLAGLSLSSCIDEHKPDSSIPGNANKATTMPKDTIAQDNTATGTGGGTGNGGN
ncbi:MAG: hypothetical protein ABIO24_04750 [Saprospiraceae bacterium]